MNVSKLLSSDATEKVLSLINDCNRFHAAVAWAGKNTIVDAMLLSPMKIGQVVVGTHMYQTDPKILKAFSEHKTPRCMPPNGKLFHPKIYFFELNNGFAAVIGSHNLTNGAFGGKNIEASILIEGQSESVFKEVREFISDHYSLAQRISPDFLFSYTLQHKLKADKLRELESFNIIKAPRKGDAESTYNLTWEDFVRGVKADPYHTFHDRLTVLERATELFQETPSFQDMTIQQRKAISGTFVENEEHFEGLDWGFFGRMIGFGEFRHLVNEAPALLSSALEQIPFEGEVTESQYRDFVLLFREAFESRSRKGRHPTASRLLAIKRPDFFVCVNGKNDNGICDSFGQSGTSLSLDNYWERIVLPMHACDWWQHERPRLGVESRIWDNRAAFYDSIYYTP